MSQKGDFSTGSCEEPVINDHLLVPLVKLNRYLRSFLEPVLAKN
jgi:hypothetical protein